MSEAAQGPSPTSKQSAVSQDLRRALLVSAGVGTALVALNQGDVLLAALSDAALPPALAWKVPLTYLVPFLVSFGSSLAAARTVAAAPPRPPARRAGAGPGRLCGCADQLPLPGEHGLDDRSGHRCDEEGRGTQRPDRR